MLTQQKKTTSDSILAVWAISKITYFFKMESDVVFPKTAIG